MSSHDRVGDVAVVPFCPPQPVPLNATAIPVVHGGRQIATAIAREWEDPADVAACRLCTRGPCVARGRTCHIVVMAVVTPEEAWLFTDARGCEWVSPAQPEGPALARSS